jgi:segregation and condensation protein B
VNEDEKPATSPADTSSDRQEGEGSEAAGGLWSVERLRPLIEALLFAAGDPLPVKKMVEFLDGATAEEVKAALADLATEHLTRGVRLIEVAGGWQMRTAPEHQRYVRKLFRERPQRLTRAATETIAIIAYKQPVTRQEIEVVRGVDTGGVLESLVERRLAKVVGRKDVPGRPLVYATTQEFLELFGLRSVRELPTLPELGSEFERMSEQGGFSESEDALILPLEEDNGAQNEAGEGSGSGQAGADEIEDGDDAGQTVAGEPEEEGDTEKGED